jgi:serine O-acetyltransferase
VLRLFADYGVPPPRVLAFHPSYQAVLLHRLSHYFFYRNCRLLARLLWHLNLVLTGADIAPISDIGPGLLLVHPISTQIFGRVGADCTFWGHGGVGGGRSNEDIGAGPGLPVVGNNVYIGPFAMVLGAIRIGDHCEIGPGCLVLRDLSPGDKVEPWEWQRRAQANPD